MFLGIDTSCYTTSIALFDDKRKLVFDQRILLTVKKEACGLRQSEMVFQHVRNMPILFDKLLGQNRYNITAIGVSSKPRLLENSYMPAFVAGTSFAKSLSLALGVKLYLLDHQQNHIRAGLWNVGKNPKEFIVLHASGGTTDLLLVKQDGKNLNIKTLGQSLDLNAGQFVDRVGLLLGLDFPCGSKLEQLALTAQDVVNVPVFVKDSQVSFSGPLTAVEKMIKKDIDKASIAQGVQKALADSFSKLLLNACKKTCCKEALLVGGVSANKFICNYVQDKLTQNNIQLYLPEAKFCGDNAIGCADAAYYHWIGEPK